MKHDQSLMAVRTLMSSLVREEEVDGDSYLVVPTILITEGVHNSELYPAAEMAKYPEAWDGRPVVVTHPQKHGRPISANKKEVIENQQIGMLLGTQFCRWKNEDGKMVAGIKSNVYISKAKAAKIEPRILDRLDKEEMTEVSTGLFTDDKPEKGVWNGEAYDRITTNFRPDHLAILLDQTGACSIKDGAGMPRILADKQNEVRVATSIWSKLRRFIFGDSDVKTNEDSFAEVTEKIQKAVSSKFNSSTSGASVAPSVGANYWVTEIFSDRVILAKDGKYSSVSYSLNEDGDVVIEDDLTEVRRATTYDPVKENAEMPPEKDIKALLPEGATLVRYGTTSIVVQLQDGKKIVFKYKKDKEGKLVRILGQKQTYVERLRERRRIQTLGGSGSGNFGHGGRPGEVGGSSDDGGGGSRDYDKMTSIKGVPLTEKAKRAVKEIDAMLDGLSSSESIAESNLLDFRVEIQNSGKLTAPLLDKLVSWRESGINYSFHRFKRSGSYRTNGGSGSGNFGHEGRPGEVGGSGDGGGVGAGGNKSDSVAKSSGWTKAKTDTFRKNAKNGFSVVAFRFTDEGRGERFFDSRYNTKHEGDGAISLWIQPTLRGRGSSASIQDLERALRPGSVVGVDQTVFMRHHEKYVGRVDLLIKSVTRSQDANTDGPEVLHIKYEQQVLSGLASGEKGGGGSAKSSSDKTTIERDAVVAKYVASDKDSNSPDEKYREMSAALQSLVSDALVGVRVVGDSKSGHKSSVKYGKYFTSRTPVEDKEAIVDSLESKGYVLATRSKLMGGREIVSGYANPDAPNHYVKLEINTRGRAETGVSRMRVYGSIRDAVKHGTPKRIK
jgi:hypothetical protein